MIKLIKSELAEMCVKFTPSQISEELTNKYGQKVGVEVIRKALTHFGLKALGREKYVFVDDTEDTQNLEFNNAEESFNNENNNI